MALSWNKYIVLKIFSLYKDYPKEISFFNKEIFDPLISQDQFKITTSELLNDIGMEYIKIVTGETLQITELGKNALIQRDRFGLDYLDNFNNLYFEYHKRMPKEHVKQMVNIISRFKNYWFEKLQWFKNLSIVKLIRRFFIRNSNSIVVGVVIGLIVVSVNLLVNYCSRSRINFDTFVHFTYTLDDIESNNILNNFISKQCLNDSSHHNYVGPWNDSERYEIGPIINKYANEYKKPYKDQKYLKVPPLWLYYPVRFNIEFVNNNASFIIESYSIKDIRIPKYYQSKIHILPDYEEMFYLSPNEKITDVIGISESFPIKKEDTKLVEFLSFFPVVFQDSMLLDSLHLKSMDLEEPFDYTLGESYDLLHNLTCFDGVMLNKSNSFDIVLLKDILYDFFNQAKISFVIEIKYDNGKKQTTERQYTRIKMRKASS